MADDDHAWISRGIKHVLHLLNSFHKHIYCRHTASSILRKFICCAFFCEKKFTSSCPIPTQYHRSLGKDGFFGRLPVYSMPKRRWPYSVSFHSISIRRKICFLITDPCMDPVCHRSPANQTDTKTYNQNSSTQHHLNRISDLRKKEKKNNHPTINLFSSRY